jgi:ATP-binding cassette, subfamily C, bacterial PrsD
VAIMDSGRLKNIGPRDEVLQSVMKRNVTTNPAQQPIRAAASTNLREVA